MESTDCIRADGDGKGEDEDCTRAHAQLEASSSQLQQWGAMTARVQTATETVQLPAPNVRSWTENVQSATSSRGVGTSPADRRPLAGERKEEASAAALRSTRSGLSGG